MDVIKMRYRNGSSLARSWCRLSLLQADGGRGAETEDPSRGAGAGAVLPTAIVPTRPDEGGAQGT